MKKLNDLDVSLINFFQKISDLSQSWLGINNFNLARICLWLYAIIFCWHEIIVVLIDKKSITLNLIILLAMWLIFNYFISRGERRTVGVDFMNEYLFTFESTRKVYLVLFIFSLASFMLKNFFGFTMEELDNFTPFKKILHVLQGLLILVVVYFVSCTPKPPKPSKLRKFVSSLTSSKQVSVQKA